MKNKNDDQDWLSALAAIANVEADPEVTRRATLLRQAIQRHDAALGTNEFDVETGLQNLKFRMRREGLGNPVSTIEQPKITNFLRSHLLSSDKFDLPYAARSSNMPRAQRDSIFRITATPAQFIFNLKKMYSSLFLRPKLPKTISNFEYVGMDRDMANNLLWFLGQGYDEDEVIASFLYALSQTEVGESFGRSFKDAIFNRWKHVVKNQNIDAEMEKALSLITADAWNWQ